MPKLRATMSYNFHSHCLKFSLFAVFLLFFQFLHAQVNPEPLKALIQDQKSDKPMAVMLTTADTLLFEDLQNGMKLRTKLAIGESSQWLTAAMILSLVDQGKLSLDDKVKKYLPIFGSYGKSYITIRDCLRHSTGIRSESKGLLRKKKVMSLEEAADNFAKSDIQNNPGEVFNYSPAGYVIAARIAEVVTKRRFDMLIRTQLLVPLAMRMTSFTTFDGSAPDPLAGAVSTPEDYIHFLQMILNNGQYAGKQVLSENSVDYLFQIQTIPEKMLSNPIGAKGLNYGCGAWSLADKEGKASILVSPAFSGPYPLIDRCRGYGLLVFTEAKEDEEAPMSSLGEALRQELENQLPEHCEN